MQASLNDAGYHGNILVGQKQENCRFLSLLYVTMVTCMQRCNSSWTAQHWTWLNFIVMYTCMLCNLSTGFYSILRWIYHLCDLRIELRVTHHSPSLNMSWTSAPPSDDIANFFFFRLSEQLGHGFRCKNIY